MAGDDADDIHMPAFFIGQDGNTLLYFCVGINTVLIFLLILVFLYRR